MAAVAGSLFTPGYSPPMSTRTISCLLACAFLVSACATKEKPMPSPTSATMAAAAAQTGGSSDLQSTDVARKAGFSFVQLSPFYWIGRMLPKKKKPPQALPPRLVGVVRMVNKEDKFVLIDAFASQAAAPGDQLVCIMNQQETANLRMSNMKNPPFLIADIVNGTPSPGDKVYKP